MIASDLDSAVARLQDMVGTADIVLPFTGAGISTECGIPDFRSPGRDLDQEPADPVRGVSGEPGGAQRILAAPLRHRRQVRRRPAGTRPPRVREPLPPGKVPAVITQNIDNLHQESGIAPAHVVELHGNTTYAHCLDCGERCELSFVREKMAAGNGCAPDCPRCGGYIKTATISFGQAMPDSAMRQAQDLTLRCDLFLAIGSSLVVWPAAGFPLLAKRNGARLVILNRDPTEFDDVADLVVRDDIGTVLAPFIAEASSTFVHRF